MSFNIVVDSTAPMHLKRPTFTVDGVFIDDTAYLMNERKARMGQGQKTGAMSARRHSTVFVDYDTRIEAIMEAVKKYMPQFYAVRENSLKVTICRT